MTNEVLEMIKTDTRQQVADSLNEAIRTMERSLEDARRAVARVASDEPAEIIRRVNEVQSAIAWGSANATSSITIAAVKATEMVRWSMTQSK